MIQELTDRSFETFVTTGDKPVVVDFWAPWCGPCKAMAPELESFDSEYGQFITIAKLNVDQYPSVAQQLNIQSIPTMISFANGSPEIVVIGAQTKNSLAKEFAKYL